MEGTPSKTEEATTTTVTKSSIAAVVVVVVVIMVEEITCVGLVMEVFPSEVDCCY